MRWESWRAKEGQGTTGAVVQNCRRMSAIRIVESRIMVAWKITDHVADRTE